MNSFIGWIGGKRNLRRIILEQFPDDVERYIEVFGGAGWVLFGKEHTANQLEVFNDYDGDLINIYRCIKYHPEAMRLEMSLLPDSREVFFDYVTQSKQRGLTDIQRAARSLYIIKTSFGSDRKTFATAAKGTSNISASFDAVQERLKKVVIEHQDFEHLIHTYDRPKALFYCDPPYVGTESYYQAQFSTADHERLAQALKGIKGRFLLSYNDCPMVRELYKDYHITPITRRNLLPQNSKDFGEVIISNYEVQR